MPWAIYTPSTPPFQGDGFCWSAKECEALRRSYPSHPSAKLLIHKLEHDLCVCVLSARLSLELIECKVCLPCEVILEWVKLYKVHWNPWGLSASTAIFFDPPAWCGVARTLCAGDMETPFLGGEAPYWRWHQGDQGVWWVPLWPAFVASQLVLLGLT
jgi:hypothetical protein